MKLMLSAVCDVLFITASANLAVPTFTPQTFTPLRTPLICALYTMTVVMFKGRECRWSRWYGCWGSSDDMVVEAFRPCRLLPTWLSTFCLRMVRVKRGEVAAPVGKRCFRSSGDGRRQTASLCACSVLRFAWRWRGCDLGSVVRGGMGRRCWEDKEGRAPPLSAGDAKRCVVMPMPNGWRAAPSLAGKGEEEGF